MIIDIYDSGKILEDFSRSAFIALSKKPMTLDTIKLDGFVQDTGTKNVIFMIKSTERCMTMFHRLQKGIQ